MNKRKWEAFKLTLGATSVRCSVQIASGETIAAAHMVTPLDTRRIDYNPWQVVLHLSRLMDVLEGVE